MKQSEVLAQAARIAHRQAELARLREVGALTFPGTSARLCANLRIIDAEVALINIEREGADND